MAKPVPQVRARIAQARETDLPELEIHRLRQRHAVAGVLSGREGAIRQRGQRRRPKRPLQPRRQPGVGEDVDARLPGPAHGEQLPPQREEVVVLALVPHPVDTKAAHQVRDRARRALDRATGQLRVLEPDRDRQERRVVPGLPVGEALVELTDEVRRLVGERAHAFLQRRIEHAGVPEHARGGEVVGHPDGLQVRREEQAAGSQHVVAIGILGIARGVCREDAGSGLGRIRAVGHHPDRRELGRPFRQPEMLPARPRAIVPGSRVLPATRRTTMRVGAPGIELERRAVVGTDPAVRGQLRLERGRVERTLEQWLGP